MTGRILQAWMAGQAGREMPTFLGGRDAVRPPPTPPTHPPTTGPRSVIPTRFSCKPHIRDRIYGAMREAYSLWHHGRDVSAD
jgi:hypothetical protein